MEEVKPIRRTSADPYCIVLLLTLIARGAPRLARRAPGLVV